MTGGEDLLRPWEEQPESFLGMFVHAPGSEREFRLGRAYHGLDGLLEQDERGSVLLLKKPLAVYFFGGAYAPEWKEFTIGLRATPTGDPGMQTAAMSPAYASSDEELDFQMAHVENYLRSVAPADLPIILR